MRPGAELRIATDIGDYARTILMALQATPGLTWTAVTPDDWRYRPDDWPATRYEEKALREGRRPCFLRIVRNGNRYQPRQSGQS
jgi:tRNA (guanine-N7-)-methyltransferase